MAITTLDGVVGSLSTGKKLDFYKASVTSEGAGTWQSLLFAAGRPWAGSTSLTGTGVICTDTTSGAFSGFDWSNTQYLLQAVVAGSTAGKLILYDRLWHNSGLNGTATSYTAFGPSATLTRPDANGSGVEMWAHIWAPIGATAATLNVRYTNSAGVTSQTATYSHPANAETVHQMVPLVLASNSSGVSSVVGYNWSTTTGTAGNLGIVLLRRVAEFPIQLINVGDIYDFAYLGMPSVYDNASLQFMVMCSATNTGVIQGSLVFGNG